MSLAVVHPALAREWHPTANGDLLANEVAPSSGKRRWWLGACGHEWEAIVSNRSRLGAGCPYCANVRVLTGFNDMATTHPDLAAEWHPTKNEDLTPSVVSAGRNKRSWWLCSEGHEWFASARDRSHFATGCPFCSGLRVIPGTSDLATVNPRLADCWHPTKNGELAASMVPAFTRRKVWWLDACGHEYSATIAHRSIGTGCPYCAGRRPLSGVTDLLATHPSLASEWHPRRNSNLTPVDVTAGANRTVWWQCALSHEWSTTVKHRASQRTGCPFCSNNRVLAGFNDLATTSPAIAAEWHPTRNGDRRSTEVTSASKHRVWWLAACGHEWQARVYSRKGALGTGCPSCSESGGEIAVAAALTEMGVPFERQWSHPTMRLKRPLRADFAVPDRRLLIEFDGEQHRRPVQFGGMSMEEAQRDFEQTQARDAAKDAWALANGWTLIRLDDVATVQERLAELLAHQVQVAS